MEAFQVQLPIEIIFGKDTIEKLQEKVEELQVNNILIITGPHLYKMGVVHKITDYIKNKNITIFAETEANPSIETVEKAKELYIANKCEAIIAFGGGSPMDVAKAVGVVATYGGNIAEYEGASKVPGKICPIIAIPTTAGTGSEVTAFSVITDHSRNYKLTVFSYELIPKVAILDPVFITSLPKSVAAATGVDALVHAIEAFLSKASTTFTDAYAEKAIQLIGTNIKAFVKDRTNLEAAEAMLAGSLYAGIAFSYARLGNVHAMAHPLSGYFDIAHGVANAVLLPVVLEYNQSMNPDKYEKIYHYMFPTLCSVFKPKEFIQEIRNLLKELEIPLNLSELGVTEDKIDAMSIDAMKSGNVLVNPRTTCKEDIVRLYYEAL